MNTLYVRSHLSRKSNFRLLTRFFTVGKIVKVSKSPFSSDAYTHIRAIAENEKQVAKNFNYFFKVLFSTTKNDSLIYPYLPELTLEALMEKALIQKDFQLLGQLFKSGLQLILQLPSQNFTAHPNPTLYKEWFSQEPDLSQTMLMPGLIDITAGNLIATQPLFTLLDCEWVLPFPVEKELVAFRYFWNLVTHFSSLLEMYPQQLDLLAVAQTNLVIPKGWLTSVLGTADVEKLNKYLEKEAALQSYILDFQKDVVPTAVELLPYEQATTKEEALPISSVTSARIKELSNKLSKQDEKIASLQDQLFIIHHSRWWQILYLCKHPRFLWHRVQNEIKLLRIRVVSKLRRLNVSSSESVITAPITDLSSLELKAAPRMLFKTVEPIDIIIPVFNAANEVQKCIASVLKHATKNIHVYIVDDLSTDHQLIEVYANLADHPQVTIYRNKQRQGFVKNINMGFRLSNHDVIILNTDTEVTENWVSKLHAAAYSLPNVATVTPMTNNGEIVSIPDFVKSNSLSTKYSLEEQNKLVERFAAHQHIIVPTGVGFCMYIRREVIDEIGNFDEETFGMGYGEENDFCQRAIQAGYINIVDDSTFIYHRGATSFTPQKKQEYIQHNLRLLFDRFPRYESQVYAFIKRNPLLYIQEMFRLALNKPEIFSEPAVLFVIHKNPFRVVGGVEVDVKKMLQQIGPQPLFFVMHRDDNFKENCLYLKVIKDNEVIHEFMYRFDQPMNILDIEHPEITWFWQWIVKAFPNIHTVHLEHTYGLPLAGLKIFRSTGKKVLLNFHDFYYACPYEKLINQDVPNYIKLEQNIEACYESLKNVFGSSSAAQGYQQYRQAIVTDLFKNSVTTFIFNSKYTLDEHKKIWPNVFTKENSVIIEPYV